MFKYLIFLLMCLDVLACPNCGGSATSSDNYTIVILAIFIVATYVPMSILFRMAMNRKKIAKNNRNDC